jgi:hypothetical protein
MNAAARADLTFLNSFGSSGTGNGQFQDPGGIGVSSSGTVYVADNVNDRVEIFNATGTFISSFNSTSAGLFNNLGQLAVSPSGTVAVADFGNNRVDLFNPNGVFQSSFGTAGAGNGQFDGPDGITYTSSGTIYVTDALNSRVETFSSSGVFESTFGSAGAGNGQLNTPIGVGVSSSGTVYISDFGNNRVETFTSAGVFQSIIATSGSGIGQVSSPCDAAVSSSGMVYIVDESNSRIEIFNPSNTLESTFGGLGSGDGQFNFPTGVAVNSLGMVYVTDQVNSRVERLFDPNSWTSGTNTFTDPTVGPTSLAVGTGQILGTSFTLNSSMGLNVGSTVTVNSGGTFTQAGGSLATATLTVPGAFNYQSGSFTAGAIIVTSGGIFNAILGGSLTISDAVSVAGSGAQMNLDGGATLTVPSGLSVNTGGLLDVGHATVVANGSNIAVQNGGEIQLANTTTSILQVSGFLQNSGLVDGSGRIVGTLQNNSTGQLSVADSQSLTITGASNTNAGMIQLSGGSLHFNQLLTNGKAGLINGNGTLRLDAGVNNSGYIALGGLPSYIYGSITNNPSSTLALAGSAYVFNSVTSAATATIHLSGNTPNIFYGTLANSGPFNVDTGAIGIVYGAYTGTGPISNNGSLYLNASSVAGTVTGSGTLIIGTGSSPAVVVIGSVGTNNQQSAVTINTGSELDITSNSLVLNSSTPGQGAASIVSELTAGYNHGAWNGMGIASSTAAANNATTLGYSSIGSVFTIKYTWYGDLSLDGAVNNTDLTMMDAGKGSSWQQGDLNYDGVKNADDYALFILGAATSSGMNISTMLPEPLGFILPAVGFLLLCRARSRR